jgi:cbb3-type cytochrome oxidase subunit 3
VLQWADQLLDALDYLHSQQPPIIHRDIKPQNVKLTSRNQIVLLDFGLAKGTAREMTQAGSNSSIFGYTPSYAPLEQAQGAGTDPRSDIYSLSATLYHLLTGTKPVDAVTRASCILNGQPDPLTPAREINPLIPPGLDEVIMQGMALKRDKRPASAAKMRSMLRDSARPVKDNLTANGGAQSLLAGMNKKSYPATEPGSPTKVFASVPVTPAAEPGKPNPYTPRSSMTNQKRAIPARVAEKSFNRARPITAAQKGAMTVEIESGGASTSSKAIVAGIALIVAIAVIAFAFKPHSKSVETNAAPAIIQKSEQVAGSEQSDAAAKSPVEAPTGASLRAEPVAHTERPAKEEEASGSDDDKDKAKDSEAGKVAEQGESKQETERANALKEPEGEEARKGHPPTRPEEEFRDDPSRPMPPPDHLHRPPPFPPPPPPRDMPPDRRRP